MAKLNGVGRSHAHSLIASGKVDKTAPWSFSAADGNDLLGPNRDNWSAFGEMHLGIDPTAPNDSKAHYDYPYGKGDKVYRSALVAIRQRSSAQNATDIYDAAGTLIDEIDGEKEDSVEGGAVMRARVMNFISSKPVIEASAKSWYNFAKNEDNPDEAELLLYDEIGGWGTSANQFMNDLRNCTAKTINLRLNSPGGSVFDGLAIYNALANHPAKVVTHIDGWAASIASVIAMAGDQILIAENAMMMIHKPWSFVIGSADDMRKEADVLDGIQASITAIYAARTGGKTSTITDQVNAETWFTGQEAVDAGFADICVPNKEQPKPAAKMATEFFDSIFALPQGLRVALSKRSMNTSRPPAFDFENGTAREFQDYLRECGATGQRARAIVKDGFKAVTEPLGGAKPLNGPTGADRVGRAAEEAESVVLQAIRRLAADINPQ